MGALVGDGDHRWTPQHPDFLRDCLQRHQLPHALSTHAGDSESLFLHVLHGCAFVGWGAPKTTLGTEATQLRRGGDGCRHACADGAWGMHGGQLGVPGELLGTGQAGVDPEGSACPTQGGERRPGGTQSGTETSVGHEVHPMSWEGSSVRQPRGQPCPLPWMRSSAVRSPGPVEGSSAQSVFATPPSHEQTH